MPVMPDNSYPSIIIECATICSHIIRANIFGLYKCFKEGDY